MAKPVWLFDLDNTLHNASQHIFPRINVAMTEFVSHKLNLSLDDANEVRQRFWRQYGATLLGLVKHHGIDMAEFLCEAHPFPDMHEIVSRHNMLIRPYADCPGEKYCSPTRHGNTQLMFFMLWEFAIYLNV
jgi:putative hydrolase of the HAD superfamily